jgi:hypothetical protein
MNLKQKFPHTSGGFGLLVAGLDGGNGVRVASDSLSRESES